MPDHPGGEHATTRAPGDVHAGRVDEAAADDGIDAGHEIVIVDARIRMEDGVAERRAVPRRAAWIHVQHDIAVGGEVLEHVAETHVVIAVRPAVNLENQGVLLGAVERRRLHDPRLHARAPARGIVDLLHLCQAHAAKDVAVDAGQPGHRVGLAQVVTYDVGRMRRITARAHGVEIAVERREGEQLRAAGDAARRSTEPREPDVAGPMIVGGEVDAAAVRRPAGS